jgi:hypothetical protein
VWEVFPRRITWGRSLGYHVQEQKLETISHTHARVFEGVAKRQLFPKVEIVPWYAFA